MFLIVGVVLGIAGAGSLVLLGVFISTDAFKTLDDLEKRVNFAGAIVRNGLMVAAGYAAFKLPAAAPAFAWAAFGTYVLSAVGLQWVKNGSFHVRDFIGTFYVTALLIAISAGALTVLQPSNV